MLTRDSLLATCRISGRKTARHIAAVNEATAHFDLLNISLIAGSGLLSMHSVILKKARKELEDDLGRYAEILSEYFSAVSPDIAVQLDIKERILAMIVVHDSDGGEDGEDGGESGNAVCGPAPDDQDDQDDQDEEECHSYRP